MQIKFKKNEKKTAFLELLNKYEYNEFYFLYSYREFNISDFNTIDKYIKQNYDYGFFKVNNSDNHNICLFEIMFKEYQNCSLLLSKIDNLDKVFSFEKLAWCGIEKRRNIFKGIEIIEFEDTYISYYI